MAYDAATKTVVLYGGTSYSAANQDSQGLSDTWTWDGTDWTQQRPYQSPSAGRTQLVYLPAAKAVLLLGTVVNLGESSGEMWSWNGSNWSKLPTFYPFLTAIAAYDESRGNVVAFGNCIVSPPNPPTYLMSGGEWRQVPSGAIPIRCGPAMTYDPATGGVLLFGGAEGAVPGVLMYGETWLWNGSAWTKQRTAHEPSARYYATAAYWPDGNRVVLFGGTGKDAKGEMVALSDTWFWDGSDWSQSAA